MNEESSVPFTEFWARLQALPISEHIGFTWWFPLLESIHVLAIGLVVGTILMVDLRLLGLAATRYPASRVTRELVPWTWIGFVVAFTTGFGMFMAGATRYVENPAFQIKFMLLPLAALNMVWFQFRTMRTISAWDDTNVLPTTAKLAGATSLLLWIGVLLAGRWTGHLL
ncbi:MAG TPA: hypothetical protein EYO94_08085 [Acidobacteria bacterium]|nr:hypothetical protein [Acidobacteriota bacterium]